jgi:hypothetical protein
MPINRRNFLTQSGAASLYLATGGIHRVAAAAPASTFTPSLAYRWIDVTLDAAASEIEKHKPRPTVSSRLLAIPVYAMYDAWAAYDSRAIGTIPEAFVRQPQTQDIRARQAKAMSYAMFHAHTFAFPEEIEIASRFMRELGYDPDLPAKDPATPEGLGRFAAEAVIADRRHDGANHLGDEVGSSGEPFSDYTYYHPVNPATEIIDPNYWQPIAFSDGKGGTVTPGFLTPHWYRVKPYALTRPDQFRAPPPPRVGSDQLFREAKEIVDLNASLSAEEKALVEFMRDGPRSTGQAGHWLYFTKLVSERDHYDIDQDTKMYFLTASCALDAFIASWETKRYYDTSRPWTLAHYYFKGQDVRGWGGPGKGTVTLKGENWQPYSPATFITPPFPGYVSGHSTVSAACAEGLRLFTGSDQYGVKLIRRAGELTEPGYETEATLELPTFTICAEMAGRSRLLGGYHISSDNVEGLRMGRKVAQVVFEKAQVQFGGKTI